MSRAVAAGLGLVVLAGAVVRLMMLPSPGFVPDVDSYAIWTHGIATSGWPHAYDSGVGYPPVMVWIWGALALLAPGFSNATDSSDPVLRVLLKAPAVLADFGIAASVGWWFRDQPRVALAAVAAVLLCPAVWYVSSWWGQMDSVFVLPALLAVLAARRNWPVATAALLAVSLMTKPQSMVFLVPFAAWFVATQSPRTIAMSTLAGAVTVLVLWLPFLSANGPANFMHGLVGIQSGTFALLSLNAFNPWWYVQLVVGSASDGEKILGPITYRLIGFAVMAVVSAVVFVGVYRRPTPGQLAMGLAAITLGAFIALTTMHERYSYPAVVFLLLCWPRREVVIAWVVLATCITVNLLYASWPAPGIPGEVLAGTSVAVAITVITASCLRWTWAGFPGEPGPRCALAAV